MKQLFALIGLLFICFSSSAQDRATIIDTTFQSQAYGKGRNLSIYLPPYYNETPETNYPVMYVFDGQAISFTDMVYGVNAALINYSESVPFIIVGIHLDNRGPELTPKPEKTESWVNNPDFGWGKGDILEQSLVKEIIPMIEKNYRTNAFRVGVGHSLGGTFVLNLKAEKKGVFHSAIAVSPNLMWDEEVILDKFEKEQTPESGFYYLSIGDTWQVEHNFKVGVERFDYLFSKKNQEYRFENNQINDVFSFVIDENADATHGTNFMISMPRALIELNRATAITEDELLALSEKETFIEDYKKELDRLAKWKGLEQTTPSSDQLNATAYQLSYEEKDEQAIQVLDWGITLYPNDYNLYDSKGEMLMNLEKYKESEQQYRQALKLLKRNKANYSEEDYKAFKEMIESNLKAVVEKAKEN